MHINVAETSFSISRVIASNLRVNQQIAPQPSPAQPSPAQPAASPVRTKAVAGDM